MDCHSYYKTKHYIPGFSESYVESVGEAEPFLSMLHHLSQLGAAMRHVITQSLINPQYYEDYVEGMCTFVLHYLVLKFLIELWTLLRFQTFIMFNVKGQREDVDLQLFINNCHAKYSEALRSLHVSQISEDSGSVLLLLFLYLIDELVTF